MAVEPKESPSVGIDEWVARSGERRITDDRKAWGHAASSVPPAAEWFVLAPTEPLNASADPPVAAIVPPLIEPPARRTLPISGASVSVAPVLFSGPAKKALTALTTTVLMTPIESTRTHRGPSR